METSDCTPPVNFRELRRRADLTQEEAAAKVAELTGGKIRDRRYIIKAETKGTDSVSLLEALAAAYGVDFAAAYQANCAARSRRAA